ncbi:MAG: protein kinase [Desulfobacterales bacterium]|nr:protein kinase [Desulfobacterales bacterium]
MGKVYKARVPVIDKVVAVKVLSPHPSLEPLLNIDELKERFIREARIIAKLQHPHIVSVSDFDVHDGMPFFVMEYYPNNLGIMIGEVSYSGQEGTRKIKSQGKRLSLDKVINYANQILSGISCLHRARIVHRDIKPENVLITGTDEVKIGDFGISKVLGEKTLTSTGLGLGSPFFIAPEQEEDAGKVDGRADIYSLGVMLYRLVAGRIPRGKYKMPSYLNEEADERWDTFILKAMEEEPEDRFQSAQEMLDALVAISRAGEDVGPRGKASPVSGGKRIIAKKPRYSPRSEPRTVSEEEFHDVFGLDGARRALVYVENEFEDNGNGTVTDHATGLMWQQSGSDDYIKYYAADAYIRGLNRKRFGGYIDWRLPTTEELMSLLEPEEQSNGLYIDPVFDKQQWWCWSADKRSSGSAWHVNFNYGYVDWHNLGHGHYVRAVRP